MMKRYMQSAIALILIVALLLPFGVTPVNAAYDNTYRNTGNMCDDIIGVALTQVGYREGSNNYTKYGVWYGLSNSPWCAMFVSWCANQAGIPTSVLKKSAKANPNNFGLSYKDGSSYTPKKGDLFFKKSFSHVGLVYYTDGAYFYTLEGNTSDVSSEGTSVLIRRRKISDYYFSTPNYSGSSSSNSNSGCNHSYSTKSENSHPHKEYKVCSKCGKTSYTGNKVSNKNCTTCIQEACNHDFSKWETTGESKHSRICVKCDLKQTGNHEWKDGKVKKEATCVDTGTLEIICTVCNTESTKEIPATGKHTYENASYIDDANHQKICSVCKKQENFSHTPSNNWKFDMIYHWTSCLDCGGRISNNEHSFSGGCLAPCDTCGFVLEDGHKIGDTYTVDSENHWYVCQRCGMDTEIQAHNYTSDCDEVCNSCNYTRKTSAKHTDVYEADETGHWRVCQSCFRETIHVDHNEDRNCNEWEDLTCVQCMYVLVSSDRHEHTFMTVESNETTHWGSCACGEILPPTVHTWDVQTGTCSACNAVYVEKSNNNNFLVGLLKNLFHK